MAFATVALTVLFVGCEVLEKTEEGIQLQGGYYAETEIEIAPEVEGIGCSGYTVEFVANQVTITEALYSSSDCTGAALGEIRTEASYSIGDLVADLDNVRELDIEIQEIVVVSHSKDWGSIWGQDLTGTCNISELTIDESMEVTGRDFGILGEFPSVNQIFFTSYKLEESRLNIGGFPDMASDFFGTEDEPGERSTDLDFTLEKL